MFVRIVEAGIDLRADPAKLALAVIEEPSLGRRVGNGKVGHRSHQKGDYATSQFTARPNEVGRH